MLSQNKQELRTLRLAQFYVLWHLLIFDLILTFTKQYEQEVDVDLSICVDEHRSSIV